MLIKTLAIMHKEILYENKKNLKIFLILELIIGLLLPSLFIYFFKSEIYIGLFTIAGPLLGVALINSALKDSKIKEINFNQSKNCIEIKKQSLMDLTTKEVDLTNFTTDLRTTDKPEDSQFIIKIGKKIKLVIFDLGEEIETMESGFLSTNNSKIINLYNGLKAIHKDHNNTLKQAQ